VQNGILPLLSKCTAGDPPPFIRLAVSTFYDDLRRFTGNQWAALYVSASPVILGKAGKIGADG